MYNRECNVVYLGSCEYKEAYAYQRQLICKRMGYKIPDTIILLHHPPVLTIGREGTRGHILVSPGVLRREGILVYDTDREGDITYHGPGQLVGYPILDLKQHDGGIRRVIQNCEEVFIRVLRDLGLIGVRMDNYPGVWFGEENICAIGFGVSSGVTYHGFAFNVNTNLKHFGYITPCGRTGKGVTSLEKIFGRKIDEEDVRHKVVRHFGEVFHLKMSNTLSE